MKILVTAGPTREPIDAVRFISNRSSGRMGVALASVALARGHEATLVLGPATIEPPAGAKVARITTADEMLAAVREHIPWCDALIMAAAVADFRVKQPRAGKLKRKDGLPALELEWTTDVLEAVGAMKGGRIFVGFAAETGNLVEEGRRKLRDKRLDLIVANDVLRRDSGFDVGTNKAVLIDSDGGVNDLPLMTKEALATMVIEWVERRHARAGGSSPCRGDPDGKSQ